MGGFFSPSQDTKSKQDSTQSGTSQSNILGNNQFAQGMGNFFSQFGQPIQANVGPNGYQYAAADSLQGGLAGPAYDIAQNGVTNADVDRFMTPYIQAVVKPTEAAQDIQNKQAISNITGKMGASGSFGNNVGNKAAYMAGVQPAQQAQIAGLYNQGFGQAVTNALQSGQQQLGASGLLQSGAGQLGNVGEQIRSAMQGAGMLPYTIQSMFSQGLSPFINAYGQNFSGQSQGTGSSQQTQNPSMFQQITGGLGALASIFSDPRMKERMREIGKTHDGQPLYAFNFKPGLGLGSETRIGLSADDVAKHDPGAVGQHPSGFMMVNYDRALSGAHKRNAADGGDIMAKVAHSFNAVRSMKRDAMADGGDAGFLSGIGNALSGAGETLFGSSQNLNTGPSSGGWDTTVNKQGILTDPATWKKFGQAATQVANQQPTQPMTDNGLAQIMSAGQQGLAQSLRGITGGREDGGRVGYEDGGEPTLGRQPYLSGDAVNMPPIYDGPGLATAGAQPPPRPTADLSGPVVVEREPAPSEGGGFWSNLGRYLAPTLYGRGLAHGEGPAGVQNFSAPLLLMSGPHIGAPAGQAMMQDIAARRADRRAADILAEEIRQHNTMNPPTIANLQAHTKLAEMQADKEYQAEVQRQTLAIQAQLAQQQKDAEQERNLRLIDALRQREQQQRQGQSGEPAPPSAVLRWSRPQTPAPTGALAVPNPAAAEAPPAGPAAPSTPPVQRNVRTGAILYGSYHNPKASFADANSGDYFKAPDGSIRKRTNLSVRSGGGSWQLQPVVVPAPNTGTSP